MRLIGLLAMATPLIAGPLLLNTGTADWKVTQSSGPSNNGQAVNTTSTAVVLTGELPFASNMPGFEQYSWASPIDGAQWIGQMVTDGNFDPGTGCNSAASTSTCGAAAGTYVYTLTIRAGFGGSFTLSSFTGDNGITSLTVTQGSGTLYACDQVDNNGTPNCAPTQHTTVSSGLIHYWSGDDVVITAVAANHVFESRNPSGFMLAGSGFANDIPEPSTYAMFAVALLGFQKYRKTR